jgi:tetratricopeptide (TPR) repeat protein
MLRIYIIVFILLFSACKNKPQDNTTLFAEAKLEIDKEHFQNALLLLDTIIARDASHDSAIYLRGRVYSQLREIENAIRDFSLLIKISESLGNEALKQRGSLYLQNAEFEKAKQDLDKAIKNDPKDFYSYYCRGIIKASMQIFGHNPNTLLHVGYQSTEDGREFFYDYIGALYDFDKAIELDSTWVDSYLQRGEIYEQSDQIDKALSDYNKAVVLDVKNVEAYFKRALFYKRNNKYSEALNDFNAAIDLDPKDPFLYKNRGHLKKENNNKSGACADYRQAELLGLKMTEEDSKYCH